MTIVFVNTRAQAELFFRDLWLQNDDSLPIGIHHGSLSREQRERVEAAMVAGSLRAVVCTGSLDLGIDWGDVDLVIQVGAPKNVKRLVQRIGRANHRYNAPSKALLVPANRFEVVECLAALQAVRDHTLDGEPRGPGPRDVLCQHILMTAASGPFDADALYDEVTSAGAYADLSRPDFDACLDFVATGGYALRAYDRWQRLLFRDGRWQLRDPRAAAQIRMNLGTIIDTETLAVRLKGRMGMPLGEVEEAFAASLTPGDINRIFFTTGGSEAVESAWKLARQYFKLIGQPQRYKVISRDIAYHGATMGALSITGVTEIRTPFEPLVPGAFKVPNTNFYRAPYFEDDEEAFGRWAADAIEQAIEAEDPATVAAVFLEPVQNAGGCFPPPPGYFQRVREICDRHGVLLVSDEVICAWGRLGHFFGAERYDYVPDMITMAKGLTSGYAPLGALAVSDRVIEPFLAGASFLHGITFAGHPVSTAVARANIDVFE